MCAFDTISSPFDYFLVLAGVVYANGMPFNFLVSSASSEENDDFFFWISACTNGPSARVAPAMSFLQNL